MSLATKGYVNSVAGDGGGGGGGGDASWGNIKGNINNQLDLNTEFVRKSTFLNTIYPTGSIVMTYTKVSPSTYIGGEWELIEEGYYPVATVKDIIDEETERKVSPVLPKFTGNMTITGNGSSKAWLVANGIIKVTSTGRHAGFQPTSGTSSGVGDGFTIDSSIETNSIYKGEKDEVKPKSILVYFWRRVDNGTLTYNFVNISFSENDFITDPTTGQISLRNAVYYYTPGTIPKADETGKLVSSNINITDLVLKTRTIAGYDLENDITAAEIQNAIKDINAILTNKTIDADNNTISNLEVNNFKTGIVRTSIRGGDQASDNNLATEKAIRDAIIEAVTGLFKIKGNKDTIAEIEALTGTEDYEAWTCSEDGHLYYWLNNKWNDFPLVNLEDLVKKTETPNSVYGNDKENKPLNYEVISDLSSNKFYRFDSTDEEQPGTYYTKTLTDGENIDLYLIVIENEKVKSITISETKGTLANGALTVNEVIYSHIESEDGYYIVNADIKLLAVSTLKDILENSGGGNVDDVQVNGTSIVENKIANFEVPSQEEIEELFDNIDSPDAWQDDDPYTNDPEDTDTLSNVDLINRKVKKITFANLFSWVSNKLASLFDAKADKSTTLSGYGITDAYTKTETDNKFQEKIDDSDETSDLNDNSKFSLVDAAAKTNKKWALSSLWTYIKGKITSIYYPVGTVIFNTGTNPSSTFGGTWSLYATGKKALYLDSTAGTTVNEELPDPSITLANNGKKTVDFKGTKGFKYKQGGQSGSWGIDYGTHELYEQATFDSVETASNHSHTVTIGNSTYKTGGTVKASGITICAWKRTA